MIESLYSFIMDEFPRIPELEIFALSARICAIADAEVDAKTVTVEEKKRAALAIIVATHKYYSDDDSVCVPQGVLLNKLVAYMSLGTIALEQNNPKMAIQHFQQLKNDFNKFCFNTGFSNEKVMDSFATLVDSNIETAKLMLPNEDKEASKEKSLQLHRKLYKSAQKGGKVSLEILSGCNLAVILIDMNEFVEANSLLAEIHSLSKRVHGPEHPDTKHIETLQAKITARCNKNNLSTAN